MLEITGARSAREIAEGHQSRVFALLLDDGQRIAAKVIDSSLVDAAAVLARVDAVAELSDLDASVCRPIRFGGSLVNAIADDAGAPALLVCFEFADGVGLDVASPSDAELMGTTLARLHYSLQRLPQRSIPAVAALRVVQSHVNEEFQLLHGDFNSGNLRRTGSTVRVFDFEDCGYGPRSFEIANSLYMVLFDSAIEGEPDRYGAFEDAFLGGYEDGVGHPIDRFAVDHFVDLRVLALKRWLDDLATAPIGIRTASPQWRHKLSRFVNTYQPRGRE